MKIFIWGLLCLACGLIGLWIFGVDGLWAVLGPLIYLFKGIFSDAPGNKELDRESTLDLLDVKRRKKKLRETNNISDLASKLTASSKRRKRKRPS